MGAVIERDDHLPSTASQPADVSGTAALMRVIERAALDPNFDVEKLNRLFDVKERWDKAEAKKAFDGAIARFKKNPPQIIKDTHVAFETSKGWTEYHHASLGQVCDAIIAGLADVDISHSWEPEQRDGLVYITCVLTHAQGHSTRTTLHSPPDNTGSKNLIQAVSSAATLLSRYTLLLATGLATKAALPLPDDDGRATGAPIVNGGGHRGPQYITDKEAADLDAMISEVGTNRAVFLRSLKVESLDRLPRSKFQQAVQQLNDIRKGAASRKEAESKGGRR